MPELTLYDIGAEEHDITAHLESNNEITVLVVNEESGHLVYNERSHIAAWESLVYFAQQVLACDQYIQKKLDLRNQ